MVISGNDIYRQNNNKTTSEKLDQVDKKMVKDRGWYNLQGIEMEMALTQVSISNLSLLIRVYQLGHFHEVELPTKPHATST